MPRIMKSLLLVALLVSTGCAKKGASLTEEKVNQWARIYAQYLSTCSSDTAKEENREIYLQAALVKSSMQRAEFDRIRIRLEADPQAFIMLLDKTEQFLNKPAEKTLQFPPKSADAARQAKPRTP
jgi:hypothetical protein